MTYEHIQFTDVLCTCTCIYNTIQLTQDTTLLACNSELCIIYTVCFSYLLPTRNAIPFTPTQVEAIRSGMQPGLTLVVGPPGTGKTDVAVQIISNLYHNFPEQVSSTHQDRYTLCRKVPCTYIYM